MRDPGAPPQGGLPPVHEVGTAVVEIACDESGFSGTNLLDAATPVFTHASVDLTVDEAVELIGELRSGFGWSLTEFKSGQFLRGPGARDAAGLLLTQLEGRGHVHVIDKEYFLATRVVDLFLVEPSYAAGTRLTHDNRPAALALYRAGRSVGREWQAFLGAFVELVRAKRRLRPDRRAIEALFTTRDALAGLGLGVEAERVLDGLSRTRVRAVLTRLGRGDQAIPPPLEPLLPALAETVLFWSAGQRQVLVIHDEQSALTPSRLRRLQAALTDGLDAPPTHLRDASEPPTTGSSPLAGLVTVDSRDDPRVQVADLLAGIARRSPNLGDEDLLRPFLSPTSLHDPQR